jgi:hypothetical protein
VPQHQDRTYWLQTMLKIAEPVLANLAEGRLAASLPAEGPPDRQLYAPLEAFARTLAGIAPWLESGTEDALRGRRPSAFFPDNAFRTCFFLLSLGRFHRHHGRPVFAHLHICCRNNIRTHTRPPGRPSAREI